MSDQKTSTSDHIHDLYTDYYHSVDPQWRMLSALDKAQHIQSMCSDIPHRTVIEIGAGDGSIIDQLSQESFFDQGFALEISQSGVERIQSRRIPNMVESQVFDGYQIPYSDQKFDLAILSHVLEHVEYPRQLIYESASVARYLFIEVPLEDTLRLPSEYQPNSVGHINFYSPASIRRLVQTCQLSIRRQEVHVPSLKVHHYSSGVRGVIGYFTKSLALKTAPQLAPHLFTYHTSLVCTSQVD